MLIGSAGLGQSDLGDSVRSFRWGAGIAALALFIAACTGGSGDDADRSDSSPSSEASESTKGAGPSVRAVTLNVLHGLFCDPETDSCHAQTRSELVATALEDAGCPELVGLQEIGPRQEEVMPAAMAEVCNGDYELAWEGQPSPDRAMTFTTLPIIDRTYLDLAAFPWEAYRIRVESDLGPIDFLTTHFASSANNPDCTAEECPPPCPVGISSNECNAIEVLDFYDANTEGAVLQIVSGDLNSTPGTPTIVTFTDAGFVDAWLEAGRAECDETNEEGCTGGRDRPDNLLDGLDVPEGRYSSRIDFILARPSADCDLSTMAEGFLFEPLDEPVDELFWASDHAGVLVDLSCGS